MERCLHKGLVPEAAPLEFECDLCGEKASSTYLLFRDNVLRCVDCGLLIHERCRDRKLVPSLALYAECRSRERKAAELWKSSLLPELRTKHAALEQKVKSMQENVKRACAKADATLWSRSWALKTFALKFYTEINHPEKCEPAQMDPLIAYYGKTPAKCRLFFERLADTYPAHKVQILVQAAEMEPFLSEAEAELNELETLEASCEHMTDLKDELQREIAFPLNPAFGVAPKWRFRLSFEGITLAMGDLLLEHVRMNIKVNAKLVQDDDGNKVPSVQVEFYGIDSSRKANVAASVSKLGLSGPMLPVSYFAQSMFIAFDFVCRLRVDYHTGGGDKKRKGVWKAVHEDTSCEVSNMRHSMEGSSLPLPSKVLDLVLSSLLTFGMKQAILAILPAELGEYIIRVNRTACDFEWRLKLESLLTREMRANVPIDKLPCLERLEIPREDAKALVKVMRDTDPRPGSSEPWTVNRVVELYRRYIRDSPMKEVWAKLWNSLLPQGISAERLWDHIEHLDNKPCAIEIDCLKFRLGVNVRALTRLVRGVLHRAVATRPTTALETRVGLRRANSSGGSLNASGGTVVYGNAGPNRTGKQPQQLAMSSRASAELARNAIDEVCASFEQGVESALSHAVRRLQFSFDFVVASGTLSLNVKRFKMVSRMGEQFEAPIPPEWLGEIALQPTKDGLPWKSFFELEPVSGALKFIFARNEPENGAEADHPKQYGNLAIQVAEVEVRIAFDGLVEELMRQQRQQLFGSSEDLFGTLSSVPSAASDLSAVKGSTNSLHDAASTGTQHHDSYVVMRVGYKGNVGAMAKGLGKPRIETTVNHVFVNGPFGSILRLARELRLSKRIDETNEHESADDDLDSLLGRLERKIVSGGSDQKLLLSLLLEVSAEATEGSDLALDLSIPANDPRPAFTFVDDVELTTLLAEIVQLVG